VVPQAALGHRGGERMAGEFWVVVGQHPGELDPDAGQPLSDVVDEGRSVRADLSPATSSPMA
jgi:hypothetical protein